MKNEINAVLENMTTTIPEPEDYTGEDGLLYCGKCRKPKEAYFAPDKAAIFGRDRHPAECDCQRTAREEREAAEKRRRHLDTVEELKRRGFTDPTMRDWTFENDNGRNPQTGLARRYVEHWEDMRTDNIGCLFWGGVGTGKSYLAGCIANALMEKEIPVRMTNFALILNDLAASFEGRKSSQNRHYSRLTARFIRAVMWKISPQRLLKTLWKRWKSPSQSRFCTLSTEFSTGGKAVRPLRFV